MKTLTTLVTVIILMTSQVLAGDPQFSGSKNYSLSTTLETADSSWVLQLIQNELYWGVQELENGDFVATVTGATGASWVNGSSWNGDLDPEDLFNELGAGNKEVRFLPIGTDSVGLVISGPDSTYLYRRLATSQTAPYVWTRTTLDVVFDSLQYTAIQGDTLVRNYPTGDISGLDITGITVTSRAVNDALGNTYFVGDISGQSVFAKYEASTDKVIYWEYGVDALPVFNPDSISCLMAGRGSVDSIYLNHPVTIVEDTIYMSALVDTLLSGENVVRIYHPITIIDENHTQHYSNPLLPIFSDWVRYRNDSTFLELYVTPVDVGQTWTLNYQIMDDNRDSSWMMIDTITVVFKVVNDSMKIDAVADQQATEGQLLTTNITVTNGMWPTVESFTSPNWLTINDNLTVSGTPTESDVGGEVEIAIVDTMVQYRGISHTPIYMRDTIRYNVTVDYLPNNPPTISVTQSTDTMYTDESLACTLHVADADDDPMTIGYDVIANATFGQTDDSSYTIVFSTIGSYILTFHVDDGSGEVDAQVNIEVIDRPIPNTPPEALSDTIRIDFGEGDIVHMVQTSDEEDDPLMFDFGEGFTQDSVYRFSPTEPDTFDVEVKVTDSKDTITCTLTIMIKYIPSTLIINRGFTPANDFAKVNGRRINYGLKAAGNVSIIAITMNGRIVARTTGQRQAGTYSMTINTATPVIVRMNVGSIHQTSKLIPIN